MAHRQTYREEPATPTTATSSSPAPAINPLHCVRNYDLHDERDTQQIADDSVAFLRIFSQCLQRFRAQVDEFAHVDQTSPQTNDAETSGNNPTKVTIAPINDTKPDEPSSATEQDDSLTWQSTQTPKLCGQCESIRARHPNMAPEPHTVNIDRTPPCPDDLYLDRLFPENVNTATEAPNPPPPPRGNHATKYLKIPWTYTVVESGKGNSHPESPPPIVDDNGNEPSESETMKSTYQKTSQPTEDTQKIEHIEREISTAIFQATLPRHPKLGLAIPNNEQVIRTADLWTYPAHTSQNTAQTPLDTGNHRHPHSSPEKQVELPTASSKRKKR